MTIKTIGKLVDDLLQSDDLHDPVQVKSVCRDWQQQNRELERYKTWVNDLQSGMYINCVYCGHRYGPQEDVPASMADVLKEHISKCPEHPLAAALAEIERLKADWGVP